MVIWDGDVLFYVFFLTVRYGTWFQPRQPAEVHSSTVTYHTKNSPSLPTPVGFIVFSFLAVPIISGFAVQAITETTAKAVGNTPLISHAEYVERFSQNQENSLRNSRTADTVDEKRLLTEALKQAVELEACARRLSINHLPGGSQAQVILKADWNVHVRDVQAIHERYRSQPQAADKSQSDVNKAKAGGGRPQDAFGRPADVRRPLSEE
ncbi:hypothetical protein FRB97_008602 [Tulasnella sp. 331]|nr:hypothetical protein FRB97_008602 [Tulasnella sp. 331]